MTTTRTARCLFLFVLGTLVAALPTGAATTGEKSVAASRIDGGITFDGRLDEPAWAAADVGTDFVQREPDTGEPASERTEFRVIYTSRMLYIGVHLMHEDVNNIIAKEMQRDAALYRDDSIIIMLDTFDDDRNAYLFEINSLGARTDALITDEGRDFNTQWDGVWDVAATRVEDGWTAEVAIPFSTLRFDPEAESWGIQLRRPIRHRQEEAFWSFVPLEGDTKRVSMFGKLTGIQGAEQGLSLNIKPFAVGEWSKQEPDEDETDGDVGLDVKWGVTRGLSLDLTVNTDFGETEVDAQQVNLTRFSLFFAEKREFFLENAGIFEFGPGANLSGPPLLKVFHSRRIGISDSGSEVPIDFGVRLAGRAGEWRIGVLDVATGEVANGEDAVGDNNWGAVRVKRNIGDRSSVGMIFTNRRRENGSTNRVGGLDLDYKLTPKLGFNTYYAQSDDPDVDEEDTWSAGLGAKWNGPLWKWSADFVEIGEGFEPQMGFLLRRGVRRYSSLITYEPRPAASDWIYNYHFQLESQVISRRDGNDIESESHKLDLFGFRLRSATEFAVFTTNTYERLFSDFEIVPDVTIPVGEYRFTTGGLRWSTHDSRAVSFAAEVAAGSFYDGDQITGSLVLRLRPNRFIRSETTILQNDINLPGGDFTANVYREQLQINLTPRLLSSTFLQYNELAEILSLNFRFNWIYKPGADLFFVYNHTWDAPSIGDLETRDRQVMVKFTYLFQR